ncbi:hypothetical protein NC653_001657 [Populus alba x Populus x berolinensis]|uniref:Uncharacterized protein n=1 Tax=Populus alba x Populus x berolinensis TaxID=444605 RepID=A0AAD6WI53_9ROSI|nr:hypothetical protein NC653_001657 [Populus alba x Populus x berolinensis]
MFFFKNKGKSQSITGEGKGEIVHFNSNSSPQQEFSLPFPSARKVPGDLIVLLQRWDFYLLPHLLSNKGSIFYGMKLGVRISF